MQVRRRGESSWREACDLSWPPLVTLPNGEHDREATLVQLASRLAGEGIDLRACASCKSFRFSGMSRQMSGATAGYCTKVGFLDQRGVVSIEHLCGEHAPDPFWPADVTRAHEDRAKESPRESRADAFEGCLLGLAIGDALGFPAEFRSRAQILESFGPNGLTAFVALHDPRWPARPAIMGRAHPPGTYSDDTQMTIAVAEAIVLAGETTLDALMIEMGRRFVEWSVADDNDRGPGNACMTGSRALARGVPWHEAGVRGSKGCGSAMRVAPIGLRWWRDRPRLLETARASSLPTHGHDAAIEGAAAAALLVALALEKRTPDEMYSAVMSECATRSSDFAACLSKLPSLLDAPVETALSAQGLGEGWVAEEAVASALWCFWRSPLDFERTVLIAANTDGDSDSIACIAGAISGAFNGVRAIPESLKNRVEGAARLRTLAHQLNALARAHQQRDDGAVV